jgi:adenosylmethionine---8-amino-7-oxononanoate aminotransferase
VDITVVTMPYGGQRSQALRQAFLAAGLLLRPLGNVLYLMPPYGITEAELRGAYQKIAKVIEKTSLAK